MKNDDDTMVDDTLPPNEAFPEQAMQGEGGARLEEVEGAPPERQDLSVIFDEWFERFNTAEPGSSPSAPMPGWVSWQYAVGGIIAATGISDVAEIEAALSNIPARTRHMHVGPTVLEPGWLTGGRYFLNRKRYRGRPGHLPDNPQSWFAVEFDEEELEAMLEAMRTAPAEDHVEQEHTAVAPVPHQRMATEAPYYDLPYGRLEDCPDGGYRIIRTADGWVPVWYGSPRLSETEAVADAWRHKTRRR